MSASGVSVSRNRGENRFYNPPHVRRQQLQQRQEQQQQQQQQQRASSSTMTMITSACCSSSSSSSLSSTTNSSLSKSDCSVPADCSVPDSDSGLGLSLSCSGETNLDRFLEHTTPVVTAQYLSKVISAI